MTKIPLLFLVGVILIIVGIIVYAMEANATISLPFSGTLSCNNQLVQDVLHNSSLTSNSTARSILSPCTNATTLQDAGIALVVVGIILIAAQYYVKLGKKRN